MAFCKDFAWGVATASYQVESLRCLLEKASDSGVDVRGISIGPLWTI